MLAIVCNKSRVLVDESAMAADAYKPAFPTGPNASGRVVFAGDFRGAIICGVQTVIANKGGNVSAIDITLQTSIDGTNWATWKALTQRTADGTYYQIIDPNAEGLPQAYIRAFIDLTRTGDTVDVKVTISYIQVGPKGWLAPPGTQEFFG